MNSPILKEYIMQTKEAALNARRKMGNYLTDENESETTAEQGGRQRGRQKGRQKGRQRGVKKTGVKKTDTCKGLTHAPYSHPKATRAARS